MPNDVKNIAVGKPKASGGAYAGPLVGTTLPTDESTALDTDLKLIGLVSEDGLTQKMDSSSQDIVAWGGDTVRKIQTTHGLTYDLTFIETNETSQKLFYGPDGVAVTPATSSAGQKMAIQVTAAELPTQVFVFELRDGVRVGRIVIPQGQVSERGEIKYVGNDAISYGVTITCYPDASGVKAYIYWDNGVRSA